MRILTDHIQEKFNYRPIIYKAGRYGIGPNTNKILHELDYKYDLSYFAQRSFDYDGGPNHREIESDIFKGDHDILHFPITAIYDRFGRHIPFIRRLVRNEYYKKIPMRGIFNRLKICSLATLTPESVPLDEMKEITLAGMKQGIDLFQMSFHSSAFTTGAVPDIDTQDDVQNIKQSIQDYILFLNL